MNNAVEMPSERKCEIVGVGVLGLTAFLFLSLVTGQHPSSQGVLLSLDNLDQAQSLLGKPGGIVSYVLTLAVGDAAHVIYGLTFIWGLMLLSHRPIDRLLTRFMGLLILAGAVAGLLQVNVATGISNPQAGGAIGSFVADRILVTYFGMIGSNIIGATLAAIGVLLATDFLFIHILLLVHRALMHLLHGLIALLFGAQKIWDGYKEAAGERSERRAAKQRAVFELKKAEDELASSKLRRPAPVVRVRRPRVEDEEVYEESPDYEEEPLERIRVNAPATRRDDDDDAFEAVPGRGLQAELPLDEDDAPSAYVDLDAEEDDPFAEDESEEVTSGGGPASKTDATRKALPVAAPAPKAPRPRRKNIDLVELPDDYEYPKRYTKPTLDILDVPEERIIPNLNEKLRATSVLLEETLQTFGIEARVTDVTRGPTITRFELEPAPGIKVARFLALADDIALALKAHRVRVEAPIPGKGRVGIEVPNQERDQVLLRELLESNIFRKGKGKLNLALGKDIAGEVQIADLATMPHLLVAGATGAGKTVCVKALLASMLFCKTPDDLQLVLIDPKMVELSVLNDIPHLITPVVTDPKKAASALSWLINEMEERYRLFADLRVRNIEVYNQSVDNGEIEMTAEDGEGDAQHLSVIRKLPYIVCVIDELADLMMLARAEVEDAIARLAQLARAVGIHLIIATQRPSVDVLTGVIKANFPARLSFQVSSRVDSRCILDEIGAERLIGMGDLLYLPAGQSKPWRIQGAFVSDEEMNSLIAYLKTQAPPQYRDEIENFGKSKDKLNELIEDEDPLLDEAVQVVLETGQASISMVQRRLRVGYTRAARLIDMMELKGIVGPHTGSKAREILVSASHQGMT